MGMINARSLKNAMKQFVKDNGREPTFEEMRDLLSGRNGKKESK